MRCIWIRRFLTQLWFPVHVFFRGTHCKSCRQRADPCTLSFLTLPWFPVHVFFFLGKHAYCIKLTIAKGGLLYVFLYNFDFLFMFFFKWNTNYKSQSYKWRTSSFRLRYSDKRVPVRQQGIYPIPQRDTRLFQADFSWGVFLGKNHGICRRRHMWS